jgi:type VI secretion system ImpB/VipA family protein
MAAASFGELKTSKDSVKAPPPETPFRIVLLGDFSGRASRGDVGSSDDIANRKSFKIARDNFDDIMKKVGVKPRLQGPDGDKYDIEVSSIDEFHPDEIFDKVSKFSDLDDADEQSKLMSAILHHPDFQAVESAWRGLYWLLARVKEMRQVQGVVVDISQAELVADLNSNDDLTKTGLYKMLVEKPAAKIDGQPWSLLLGLYTFDLTGENINALGRMAKIAREAVAPFLAAVPVQISEKDWKMATEDMPAWEALRQLPEASLLGLAMPRFLLRQPYGENTKSIDKFSYEEYKGPSDYLLGNPALLCAALLAQSFAKEGWGCKAGTVLELAEMVMHVSTDEDGDRVGRLAEAMLTRKEGEKVGPMGLMNFICSKDRDIVQLVRFQSVAMPPKGQSQVDLTGQWGQKGAIKLPPSSGKPGVSVAFASVGSEGAPAAPKTTAKVEVAAEPEAADEAPAKEESPAEKAPAAEEAAAPAAASGGAEEMDPELAALMKQLEGGGGDSAPAKEEKKEEKPAEEAMDPELAALMKQLEGGGDSTPAKEEKKEEKPAEEEMDPELAALMKQLEGK